MKKFLSNLLCKLLLPVVLMFFAGNALQAQWVLEVEIDGVTDRFPIGTADFGPQITDTLSGPAIIGMDGSSTPQLGCESLTNDLSGSFGILRRGDCPFKQKALNAQNAGAIALIICNTLDEIINMPDADEITEVVSIQTVLLSSSDCRTVREAVEAGSDVSISLFEVPFNVIWGGLDEPNSTFDGGLNDWTTSGPNGDLWYHAMPITSTAVPDGWGSSEDPDNPSHYDYTLHPDLELFPRFYGTGTDRRIISESLDNGFAMIDVDSWNNTPNEGMFTDNMANGELISPVIDLSGFEETGLALTFTQSLRFCCGAQSVFTVQVSTDGFQTSTSFDARGDQALNAISRNRIVTLNLTEALQGIGDLSNFQIKFIWNTGSSHYFWMIDDVRIIELPEVNLKIEDGFFPMTSVCIPAPYTDEQEMNFGLVLSNVGGADQELIEAIVQVENVNTSDIMFSESQQITNFSRGTTDTITFENSFVPAGLPVGDYVITYRVRTPGAIDFEPGTNVISYMFRVTGEIYANEDCFRDNGFRFLRPGGDNVFGWYWGNAFFIGEMERPNDTPRFLGAQASVTLDAGEEWADHNIFMHLIKFNEPGKDAFDNFNSFQLEVPNEHDDLTPIALAIIETSTIIEAGAGNLFEIPYTDFFFADGSQPEPGNPIELDPNHYYMVFLQLDEDRILPPIFVGTNAGNITLAPRRELLFNGENYIFFNFESQRPTIRMRTDILSNTNEGEIVRDNPFLIYPVPASNELNIDFDLPIAEDVNIEVFDVQGRLIERSLHPNVGTQTINKNVSEFRSGNYLIRIITENGVQTQQVIIVK